MEEEKLQQSHDNVALNGNLELTLKFWMKYDWSRYKREKGT